MTGNPTSTPPGAGETRGFAASTEGDLYALPSRLDFRLAAGPWEPAFQFRWKAQKLEYQAFLGDPDDPDEERTIALYVPSRRQWAAFWRAVDDLGIWEWAPEYRVEGGSGATWRLELRRGERAVNSSGHGAFPGTPAAATSPEFEVLLDALRSLIDGRPLP